MDCVPLGREGADVTDLEAVRAAIRTAFDSARGSGPLSGPGSTPASRPSLWVIHCAAYTAVDRAESDPDQATRVNRDGAENVARAAAEAGARFAYISTDYVYDGDRDRPWLPTDPVAPRSVYARSKLDGERAAERAIRGGDGGGPGAGHAGRVTDAPLIVRTGWLYGAGGRNFVRAILDRAERGEDLRVVDDQRGRPTWARNVAEVVLDLAERGGAGIWHVADGGDATWLEFAREAVRLRGLEVRVEGVSTQTWGAAAPRPGYSVLDLTATEDALGRAMMTWKEALRRFLDEEPS
jgi:dTDP-4-dehydrorhamnose reductase